MKALVTGGSGFIGSEVIRQLTQRGFEVRALLRKTSSLENLSGAQFETAYGDITDFESLKKAVQGVSHVFHLAGTVAAQNREAFFRHNADGTGQLAKACEEANPGLSRFLYVSSLAASGPAQELKPKNEDDHDAPVSDYGESKLEGEKRLLGSAKRAGFSVSVVRPPAVYGPRDKGIFEFIKIVNKGILPHFGKQKFYSVIHVEDLVRGIVEAGLVSDQDKWEVYYLSGNGVFSWMEMMEEMALALEKKTMRLRLPFPALKGIAALQTIAGKILNKQFPLTLDKLKELEPDFWICSNEKAKARLGFEPQWDLRSGLKHTIDWYKQNQWL